MRIVTALLCACVLAGFSANPAVGADLNDDDIRKILIRNSIAATPATAPAPTTPTALAAVAESATPIQNLAAMHRFAIHRK